MRLFARNCRIGWAVSCVFAGVLAQAVPVMGQTAATKASTVREPLEIKLVRNKVTVTGGKEILTSAATARPGEILQEVATYTNKSDAALTSLEATLPVPVNTELVMASAKPGSALASTDGKNFSAMPLKRRIRQARGVESEQEVAVSEYKFLRWRVAKLPAAGSMVFSARFKVLDDAPAISAGDGKQ